MQTTLNYYMPTRVIMGIGCIANNSSIFEEMGTRALLVTGRNSAKLNGSERDVTKVLAELGIPYVVFDQVMSNPTIDCVYDGAKVAKDFGADFVIAIGGGSPMDAGKAIALLAAQEIPREDLFSGNYTNAVLPMIHIPTTAGTGSEVTQYSILTNDIAETKTSIASPVIFPKVAFLDPTYMEALSHVTTINTTVDALSHAVEGMLSVRATEISNALALESIAKIVECYAPLKEGTLTVEQRGALLYASMLAGIVIAHTGTTAVHSMGYSLTYFRDVDHGRANGLLLPEFFRFVEAQKPEEVRRILGGMGLSSVEEFEHWMRELLGEIEHYSKEELAKYASIAIKAKNIGNCKVVPTQDDLRKIFETALL